jgi:hypothetical protein
MRSRETLQFAKINNSQIHPGPDSSSEHCSPFAELMMPRIEPNNAWANLKFTPNTAIRSLSENLELKNQIYNQFYFRQKHCLLLQNINVLYKFQ